MARHAPKRTNVMDLEGTPVPEELQHYACAGINYGYPACCIRSFLERVKVIDGGGECEPHPTQELASSGTGFLPCLKHAQEVVEQRPPSLVEALRVLLSGRTFPLPFPHGHNALAAAVRNVSLPRNLQPHMRKALEVYGALGRGDVTAAQVIQDGLDPKIMDFLVVILHHSAASEKKVPGSEARRLKARIQLMVARIKSNL